jgi:hypothetical protein
VFAAGTLLQTLESRRRGDWRLVFRLDGNVVHSAGSQRLTRNVQLPYRGDQLMIYEGKAITVKALESGIVELNFDLKGESVNKFNRLTLNEFRQAVDAVKSDASIKGVIVTSGKDSFIVGADITEFVDNFK